MRVKVAKARVGSELAVRAESAEREESAAVVRAEREEWARAAAERAAAERARAVAMAQAARVKVAVAV